MGHGLHIANSMNDWIRKSPKPLPKRSVKSPPVNLFGFSGFQCHLIKIGDYQVLLVCLCVFWYVKMPGDYQPPSDLPIFPENNTVYDPESVKRMRCCFIHTTAENDLGFPCLQGMLSRESQPIRQSKTLVLHRDRPQHFHNGRPVQYILGSKRWGLVGSLGTTVFFPENQRV